MNQIYNDETLDNRRFKLQINTPEYLKAYLRENYPRFQIKSIIPFSFCIGTSNHGVTLQKEIIKSNCLYFGILNFTMSPISVDAVTERVEIEYTSFLNFQPYKKRITRLVVPENTINENSSNYELFEDCKINFESNKYDTYLNFVGYRIDLI